MKTSYTGDLSPKKSFGQNFLINEKIQDRIISACEFTEDDTVLEIGPGKGALTFKILPHVKKVFAVEKDSRMANFLQEQNQATNLDIINEDFLKFNFDILPDDRKIKVVGNLPYNMATPIIEKIINNRQYFSSFYMTVQLEYGERLCADISCKAYGSLSCFIQMYADPKFLFRIKNTAFFPKPKVESCFLKLDLLDGPRYDVWDEKILFQTIKTAFSQRRKTIVNALSPLADKKVIQDLLTNLAVDLQLRPENIPLQKFVEITNQLNRI